jgi:hypothetical protein
MAQRENLQFKRGPSLHAGTNSGEQGDQRGAPS